jgi:cytochrome b561
MSLGNSRTRYGAVAQLFHWLIVFLIITQFVLASMEHDLPPGLEKLVLLARHKSVGITVLILAVLRLLWRWFNPTPELPRAMPTWERLAARASHFLLYALILAIPLTGWMMSSAKNYSVSWFGLFTLPNLVPPNENSFDLFHEVHEFLATVLFYLALIHIAAALKHHFYNRDNVLRGMLPVKDKSRF